MSSVTDIWNRATGTIEDGKAAVEQGRTTVQQWTNTAQGYAALVADLQDPAKRANLVEEIRIETRYSPDQVLSYPFRPRATTEPGFANKVGQLLKPRITVKIKGLAPIVAQPFGSPEPKQWGMLKFGLIASALGIGFLAVRGLRSCPR